MEKYKAMKYTIIFFVFLLALSMHLSEQRGAFYCIPNSFDLELIPFGEYSMFNTMPGILAGLYLDESFNNGFSIGPFVLIKSTNISHSKIKLCNYNKIIHNLKSDYNA